MLGEELDELVLGEVRVLELVHEDVLEPLLVAAQDVGAGPEEPERLDDLIAEVHLPEPDHQRLVLRIGARQVELLLGLEARLVVRGRGEQRVRVGEVLLRSDVLVLQAADVADDGLQVTGRVAERPVVTERQLEEVGAQEDDLLGAREHAKLRRQAELEGVLADQVVPEGVEGRDLHIGVPVGDERVDPLLHLDGRLVREGQREDLGRTRAPRGDQVGDPARDDGGLARPRARDDEQRPRLVRDGRRLRRVEAVEDPIGSPRGLRHRPDLSGGSPCCRWPSAPPARGGSRRARPPRSCT